MSDVREDFRKLGYGVPVLGAFLLLGGCMGSEGSLGVYHEQPDQDRQVALYIYPPTSSGIPTQVVPLANIQSDTTATINLDPGVTVTGQLLVAGDGDTSSVATPISGEVTATIAGTTVSFDADVDPETNTFALTLPQGRYDVAVIPNDAQRPVPPHYFSDISISSRNGGVLTLPALDPGVPLVVHVTWPDGTALEGARVYTLDPETGFISSTTITSEGAAPGTYMLQVAPGDQGLWIGPSSAGDVPLCTREITSLTVQSGPTAQSPIEYTYPLWYYGVSGQTVNSVGQPVEGVTVFATRQAKGQDGSFQAQTQTDADGEFRLDLPEGTYELVFRPASTSELSGTRVSGVVVDETTEGWVGSIVLINRVELELTVRGPEGSPVANAAVTVQADPNDRSNPGTSTFTNDNGLCVLTLGVGSYYISVDPPQDSDLARQVTQVTVTQDMTSLEDIRLEQGFSSTLTFLADDVPVPGLVLQAWEALDDGTYSDSPVSLLATAISDESGQARLVLPFP